MINKATRHLQTIPENCFRIVQLLRFLFRLFTSLTSFIRKKK